MELRSHIAALLSRLGVKWRIEYVSTNHDLRHPKQQVHILVNKEVVWSIVTVHPSLAQTLKLPKQTQVSIAQCDLTLAQQYIPASKKSTKDPYSSKQLDEIMQKAIAAGEKAGASLR